MKLLFLLFFPTMHILQYLFFILPATAASSFSIEVRNNHDFHNRNGPAALRNAYRKHGIPVPPHLEKAANERRDQLKALQRKRHARSHVRHGHSHERRQGSVTSTPTEWDIEYLSPVTVGNQTLQLNMDTGSADLWVFSSDLDPAIVGSRKRGVYVPGATASNLAGNWSISYSDGSYASGRVVLDTVSVGPTKIENQAVEMASTVSPSFIYDEECDGILGLAYSSINTVRPNRQKTFFENALSKLPLGVFTVDLKQQAVGSIDFGIIDSSKYKGNITYMPVRNGSGFWQFEANSNYYIGKKKLRSKVRSRGALADTGTTLLLMHASIVSTYWRHVKGAGYSRSQGGYIFPCNTTLPTLKIAFGASAFVPVNGSLLNFGQISSTLCYGGLQSIGTTYPAVYGDIFFKAAFAVFDYTNKRFGFALKP